MSLVIQNDISNHSSYSITTAPIIYNFPAVFALPTRVLVSVDGYSGCVVLLDNIQTIHRSQLIQKVGELNLEEIKRVEHATNVALGSVEFNYFEEKQLDDFYKYKLGSELPFGEDHFNEFKEIIGRNPRRSILEKVDEYVAAFLNSAGGRILYGISNDRIVRGVELGYEARDTLVIDINNKISNLNPAIGPEQFDIAFKQVFDELGQEEIKDRYIVEINVPRSPFNDVHFINNTELYVRANASNKKLVGSEIVTHIRKRFCDS
ncbi:hypothetical protein HP552_03100 [Paenibacillus xylanilyticus]|uniref:Schlafen AlbA-2 domain-containing protein n=1 Tax=Paenibacillus xylanilyticus TaxID=248903 RepID=A0A7Y6EUC9_9BACL|nr:hypothetical protein [Paenibacillus xylanilyticus]